MRGFLYITKPLLPAVFITDSSKFNNPVQKSNSMKIFKTISFHLRQLV